MSAQARRRVRECDESGLRILADPVTQASTSARVLFIGAGLAAVVTAVTTRRGRTAMLAIGSSTVALLALVRKLTPWLVVLFSRLGRDKLLAHPTRAAALGAIQARPGVRTTELAAALGANSGTLDHHLRALARAGLVKPLVTGKERAWFAAGAAIAAPRTDAQRRIIDSVTRNPGLTQRQLAAATGIAPSTVSHHVRTLADAVEARPDGRTKRLFALRPREDL